MLRKTTLSTAFILISTALVSAQLVDTTSREAPIVINQNGNSIQLSADTPPLIQISGAPEAFYTYFWEFGDGHFSEEETPNHVYETPGTYEVRLQATNNYDNGKPPPSRPKTINVNDTPTGQPSAAIGDDFGTFDILKNREPIPEEELVVVMRYANEFDYATNGKLYLYYNERKFKADNFQLLDVRTHYGEQQVEELLLTGLFVHTHPAMQWASLMEGVTPLHFLKTDSSRREHLYITIDEAEQEFRDKLVVEFKDMAPGAKRNMFISIKTTPEMIQDTSAIIKMRGVFVPDGRSESHQVKDLEMEIVTSHDPNKMAVNDTRINYRLRKSKKLKYKIRFQNNGEGPATRIKLDVDVPPILDLSTLEVLDMHPKCAICPDQQPEVSYSCLDTVLNQGQVSFIFKNVYLPGSNQKGVNEYDSTKGFVKYSVKLHNKAEKINSKSRTAIIFDKNEPIITNYAKTYFKPGLSLGAKAGYRSMGDLQDSRDYFFGITASPYMPYRGYLQAELMASFGSYKETIQFEERSPFGNGIDLNEIQRTNEESEYEYVNITLVPISYRYNFNKIIGVGGGVQVSTKLYNTADKQIERQYFIEFLDGFEEPMPDRDESETLEVQEGISDFNPGAFVGLNVGMSRIGPSLGLRYVYQLNEPNTQLAFYLTWKF